MDAIKQWGFSICATMVACGLIQILLPKSNLEKVFSLTVSVFFLCCLLSPFLPNMPQLRLELEEAPQQDIQWRVDRLTEELRRQTEMAVQSEAREIVEEELRKMGINWHSIAIDITIKGQNTAEAASVRIVLDREMETKHAYILSELERKLDMAVRLEYG